MKSAFETCHPLVNFLWFGSVILLNILLLHPVFLAIAAVGAACYGLLLGGRKTAKFILCFLLPMIAVIGAANLLVSHQGVTILGYLGDNPLTKEALIYGLVSGLMFASLFLWFSCYNVIMTSDKFVYLFGRIVPAGSLVFSMLMGFIPRFKAQMNKVSQAQKWTGSREGSSLLGKARHGMKLLSILTTWALENSIDTADSMKSRGYGLRGRTAFSIYRFDIRDGILFLWILLALSVIGIGGALGLCRAQYYPYVELADLTAGATAVYGAYVLLCFLPVLLDIKEGLRWRRLQSKI